MTEPSELLFVYGSLMRGQHNHAQLRGALWVGPALTAPSYSLVSLGPYPALRSEGSASVPGELYALDATLLPGLDCFEGHPDWYLRRRIELDDGQEPWAYVLPARFAADAPAIPCWPIPQLTP